MLTFYVIATVVGGVFVLLSAFGGGDTDKDFDKDFDFHDAEFHADADFDGDVDIDVDFDVDADVDVDADADADHDIAEHVADAGHADIWLPFLSMRFWTYFFAFFGATGLLLTYLWREGLATAVMSGGMGLACGLGMAYGTRWLKKSTTHSGAGVHDFVGNEAGVLIAIRAGSIGKIRCLVKGREVDLLAKTDDPGGIESGARVLVIGFDGPTARVVRASYALADQAPEEPGESALDESTTSEAAEVAVRREK